MNQKEIFNMVLEKFTLKNFIKLIVAFGILVGIIVLLLYITNQPKPPATSEHIVKALQDLNYNYEDLTEEYIEQWKCDEILQKAISAESENIRFDFFIFDSVSAAEEYRKSYRSHIYTNYYKRPSNENKDHMSNWNQYILETDEMYVVCTRVDNTLLYAYCRVDHKAELHNLVTKIGYFD